MQARGGFTKLRTHFQVSVPGMERVLREMQEGRSEDCSTGSLGINIAISELRGQPELDQEIRIEH